MEDRRIHAGHAKNERPEVYKSVVWTTEPHGLQKFAAFMKEAKFVEKLPKDWLEVTWENLHGKQGN